jgi:PhzF family phenazine biosynthesis protein
MRRYPIHHIDSFTNTLFGGNPTVTVLQADSLSVDEMKKIAREMNLSETSFLLPSIKATFRLRFFTPTGDEVKFCGHATVGALCTIAREGLFGCDKDQNNLSIETDVGILNVLVDRTQEQPKFIFDSPKIDLAPSMLSHQDVIEGMGISKEYIETSMPVVLEKTNNYLYLVAKSLDKLGKIQIDCQKAYDFCKTNNLVVVCIFTNETHVPGNHFHARGFAPLIGIPEDPFTGSMQGGLVAYGLRYGAIPADTRWITVEQGHFMQRPGYVKLEIIRTNPIEVKLHAEATHVFSAELNLP